MTMLVANVLAPSLERTSVRQDPRAEGLVLILAGAPLRSSRGAVSQTFVGLDGQTFATYHWLHCEPLRGRPSSSIRYRGTDLDHALTAAQSAETQMRSLGLVSDGASEQLFTREAFERANRTNSLV